MAKIVIQADWDSAPHLSQEQKDSLLKSMRPHQRNARMKGIPVLGAGAIYPVDEDFVKVPPFAIPKHWRKAYALDVGWKRTAAIWGAVDDGDVMYLYSEHYLSEEKPPIHVDAIKSRGQWMFGVIDPASNGRSQSDGERLYQRYTELGLKLAFADNAIDAGLDTVWERLVSGRLKVFSNLSNWFYEFRLYRRDEKGKIVKKDDHLMDATRYLCMSGINYMTHTPGAYGRQTQANNHVGDWDPFEALVKGN